jgi:S1-C subfamily serine protease
MARPTARGPWRLGDAAGPVPAPVPPSTIALSGKPEPCPHGGGIPRLGRRALAAAAGLVLAGLALGELLPGSPGGRKPIPVVQTAGAGIDPAQIARLVAPGVVTISAVDAYEGDRLSATGIVLASDGEVLTNNHAVEGATSIDVRVGGVGPLYVASVTGADPGRDIAVLRILGAPALRPLVMSGSARLRPGSPIVVLGNDGPGPPSASPGQVVALGRDLAATDPLTEAPEHLLGMIEMDVPVQPGDSGGPVLNSSGEVVAMTTAGEEIADGLVPADAAYAIPIADALAVARQIEDGIGGPGIDLGPPAFLGVEAETYSPAVEAGPPPVLAFLSDGGAGPAAGALVLQVLSGSPAAAAGLRPGDVIVRLADDRVDSLGSLRGALEGLRPATTVQMFWVDPAGNRVNAFVQLGSGPAS